MARVRSVELVLLVPACGVALAGLAALTLAEKSPTGPGVWPAYALAAVFLLASVMLAIRRPGADQLLLPIVAALCSLGLFVVARAKPEFLPRQVALVGLGVGLLCVVLLAGDVFGWLRRYRYTWAVLGVAVLVFTLVFGVDPNESGVRIWVGVGDYLFQPSELVKVLMVAFLAAYLDEKRELLTFGVYKLGPLRLPPLPYLAPSLVMMGISLLLFLVQRDLGVTFLFFGVFVAMLYAVSGRGVYVLGALATLGGASYLVYHLFRVAQLRVDLWLNPWSDPQNKGYQIIQALVAFASGGVFGAGPGYGAPDRIPAAYTDFPFAVIGEELGLVGALAVVALFLFFMIRGFRIALDLGDSFQGLLALGLSTTVGLQALIILAGNLKLVPLTGITLPFVSYGGSSLLTNFIILGLLLRLSAETPEESRSG